ncbi:MAG: hypothetical protein EOS07_21855 [Mesorhizobium sp.]|uniref:hypothetical protein n=1 Tax=Mesorhizobium sp. TaxID=1871066 RepID=UPI000FE74800|nr:hypothetical protein [Mesorhizobium sp.]RWO06288.1 MAG: hypothetical protein EOS07_21855 [Mesorhizobium sp.]RWP69570.1 MAG: hypothetical protein EOR07_03330 [Mesorhizobium sp.]
MAVFLPIVPNWQNGVRDTYEFKTDVFTTRDGSEQRRSLRVQPRRSINAAVLLDGERLRTFSDALHLARDGKVEIADFSADGAVLTSTVANGATVLTVDHVPAWLAGGITCVLQTGRQALKVTVELVDGNNVTLSTGVAGSVGQGAQLLPLLPASLGKTTTLSIYTTLVATSAIKFDIEPGTVVRIPDPLPIDGGPDAETTQFFGPAAIFYGRYVLLRKPNYLQQPQMAFNLGFETVDYGRGITKTFTPVPTISRTLTATYLAVSHADAMAMLDIFLRAKGRAGEIYVPTWGNDLPPVKGVTGNNIRVAGTQFFDAYGSDDAHRALLIRTKSGTLIPHEIVGMTTANGDTLIATTDTIGAAANQIESISWMFVARFAQDNFTIQWLTNGVANISLSFVTLSNLASDDSFGNNWILATGQWRDLGQWHDDSVWIDD